ncbi:MAG: hypothetical protein JSV67_03410 [Thermoplasmatales archaeon]|nr:MAG: hypothetical protein JSV67_03410 [Thermoplasmatales archaeon]
MKKITILVVMIFLSQMCIASAFNHSIFSIQQNTSKVYLCSIEKANYVIITTSELEDAVKDFKTWKEYPGFTVEIVTISWISDNYNGRDLAEQIRNFLIDKYEEWEINYVLIVGTRNNIPMRRCDPIDWDYGDHVYNDFYYSDLTGNWDVDQDGIFGEYGDDDVDFIPEISIGRIPSDSKDTVAQICENIMNFGSGDSAWKKNALLLGAISYYQGLESYGWVYDRSDCATLMEECRIDIFDPEDFNCVRMYEAEGLRPSTYDYEYPLEHSNVLSEYTKNYGIVNIVGHSNEQLAARWIWVNDDGDNIPEVNQGELIYKDILTRNDAQVLSMEKPPIVFSGGCSQLHGPNNMGRRFIEKNAAVAYIGTTDLGFYNITRVWNDESDGGFASIDYYFFYYLISYDQGCGDALGNSKAYFSNYFMFNEYNPEWIYRCYSTLMGTTLYGDPSLSLFPISNPPERPCIPDGPVSGRINIVHSYSTSSIEPDGGQIRYLFDWGDGNKTITEYYTSGKTIKISYKWNEHGKFNIKVRAQDEHGVWSDWSDSLSVSITKKSKSVRIFDYIETFKNICLRFPIINNIFSQKN